MPHQSHLNTIVSIAFKTAVGSIPVVGALAGAIVSEYQQKFTSDISNRQLLDLASALKRDAKFLIPLRFEILNKHIHEPYTSGMNDLNIILPENYNENLIHFQDWLHSCDSEMNVAEQAYFHSLILLSLNNNFQHLECGQNEVVDIVLEKTAIITKNIESCMLLDSYTGLFFYWRLAHFLKMSVKNENAAIAVARKAMDCTEDPFLALGIFLYIYNSCLIRDFHHKIEALHDKSYAANIGLNKITEIEMVLKGIEDTFSKNEYKDLSKDDTFKQLYFAKLQISPTQEPFESATLYAKIIIIAKTINRPDIIIKNSPLLSLYLTLTDVSVLDENSVASKMIQTASQICTELK